MEGGKKSVFASFFGGPEDREFVEKMRFGASYSMSNNLLLIATHYDYGPPKMPLKLTV